MKGWHPVPCNLPVTYDTFKKPLCVYIHWYAKGIIRFPLFFGSSLPGPFSLIAGHSRSELAIPYPACNLCNEQAPKKKQTEHCKDHKHGVDLRFLSNNFLGHWAVITSNPSTVSEYTTINSSLCESAGEEQSDRFHTPAKQSWTVRGLLDANKANATKTLLLVLLQHLATDSFVYSSCLKCFSIYLQCQHVSTLWVFVCMHAQFCLWGCRLVWL